MLKVLATGGAGYVGSHCVVALEATGRYSTTIADIEIPCARLSAIRKLCGKDVPAVKIDLCDWNSVDKLFEENKFDAVIHFAAFKAVGESIQKPTMYFHNNLVCLLNVLKAMEKHNCKVLVQSSSCTVYGSAGYMCDETKPYNATSPYGRSKVIAEQMLKDVCEHRDDMKVVLLRYFNPVGAHESGMIGESPLVPLQLMPTLQQVAIGRIDHVKIFGHNYDTPDGTCIRDYVHVQDIADGHVVGLDKLLAADARSGSLCWTYNLGMGKGVSVLELVHMFERINKVSIKVQMCDNRSGDVPVAVADVSKVYKDWNWKATRSLEDACASAWKFQSAHPNGDNNNLHHESQNQPPTQVLI